MIWWTAHYTDTDNHYDSSWLPFKLLPHLAKVSIEHGHIFNTNHVTITSHGVTANLRLGFLTIPGRDEPYHVPNANRIILYRRKYQHSDGSHEVKIFLGVADKFAEGFVAEIIDGKVVNIEQRDPAFSIEDEMNEEHIECQ